MGDPGKRLRPSLQPIGCRCSGTAPRHASPYLAAPVQGCAWKPSLPSCCQRAVRRRTHTLQAAGRQVQWRDCVPAIMRHRPSASPRRASGSRRGCARAGRARARRGGRGRSRFMYANMYATGPVQRRTVTERGGPRTGANSCRGRGLQTMRDSGGMWRKVLSYLCKPQVPGSTPGGGSNQNAQIA